MAFKSAGQRRAYQRNRYRQRRAEAVALLGSECATCGVRSALQVDHVDPAEKEMSFPAMAMASRARFLAEVAKCQLLCESCHVEKTKVDGSKRAPKGEAHGNARLTTSQVEDIKRLRQQGWTMRAIGVEHGVSHTHVSRILSGKRWTSGG